MANFIHAEVYTSSEESGSDDSEEDIITDYLSPLDDNGNVDATTDYQTIDSGNNTKKMATSTGNNSGSIASNLVSSEAAVIPTISVTQHSPAASKSFYILEDNLRQLHGIQENIQRMRQVSVQTLKLQFGRRRLLGLSSNLSASCPSLTSGRLFHCNDADWLSSTLCDWDSPTPPSIVHCWGGNQRDGGNGHRLRSASISSLDTDENDDNVSSRREHATGVNKSCIGGDTVDGIFTKRSRKVIGGGHSTHSLNDMGVPLVVQTQHRSRHTKESESSKWLSPRILTLQKSISTPSILAVKDGSTIALPQLSGSNKDDANTGPTSSFSRLPSFPGLESETDDETELHLHHHTSDRYLLGGFLTEPGYENDEEANASKRPKRGSLFFRKKKDKDKAKAKLKNPHHFFSVCHSNSQLCDVCAKSLTNKPAIRCESCGISVHENTCRDQVNECTRFKVPKSVPLSSKSFASISVKNNWSSANLTASFQNLSSGIATNTSQSVTTATNSSLASAFSTTAPSIQTPSTPVASPLPFNSKPNSQERNPDSTPNEETTNTPVESDNVPAQPESNEEVVNSAEVKDLDLDPELGILEEEPEAWVGTVDKKIAKKLKEKEVKRQEHIYEFIITEKHHCLTLKVMQKIFAEGMRRELHLSRELVDRIFPCLEDLLDYHLQFLRRLRQRQRQEPIVKTIEDILRLQFSGTLGDQLRSLYGEFCSRHQEAVSMYKELAKEDRKFATFVRQCTMNPLCKKKGIPECILFVTQRITKYPLLIDPLIKTTREQPEECQKLQQVLAFVKDILVGVNAQVAEKERKLRLIEIYNKIDAKSATTYRNKKFKKSDLLSSSRRLMFEGAAFLNHARGKVQLVTVVVLSDVVFFLQESNQKFHFVTQDSKAGVISLQKLLVREKAGGQDTRSIYLISSNPDEPEMYELQCQNPREKKIWIDTIRAAVEQCPEDEEEYVSEGEEQRKIREAQSIKIKQLIGTLKEKDRQLSVLLEDKMGVLCELIELLANNEDGVVPWNTLGIDGAVPKYGHLLNQGFYSSEAKETLSQALSELFRLLGVLYSANAAGNWNLSRSASSVGEKQSEAYSLPLLPKRAETFGGFDHSTSVQTSKDKGPKKKTQEDINENASSELVLLFDPPLLQLTREQQLSGIEMVHHVSSLLCLLSSQATALETVRSELLAEIRASSVSSVSQSMAGQIGVSKAQHKVSHNQRLEELRNLQDRLSKEKAEWQRERSQQEEQIAEQRKQLLKLQEQVRSENADVQQQRENLYQKLEALRSQGILLSPNMTIVSTAPIPATPVCGEETEMSPSSPPPTTIVPSSVTTTTPAIDLARRRTIPIAGVAPSGAAAAVPGMTKRDSSSNLPLPINLLSAKNEQKAVAVLSTNQPIRQQLPMKLAKSGNSISGINSTTSSSSNANIVQQLLPLRLSEHIEQKRNSPKGAEGPKIPTESLKPKLSSNSFSPPTSKSEDFTLGHSRTGSSPASIQMLGSAQRSLNYPKVPDKPASLLSHSKTPQQQHTQQPKVRDPDTNQEIVFL